jgi:hypothetical protein
MVLIAAPLAGPDYEGLLARQDAGEILDLSKIQRPGLAFVNDDRLSIAQGSGRFGKLKEGELMELFVPAEDADLLPKGVKILEKDVPARRVRTINLLSSRGKTGANPNLVEVLAPEGSSFLRVSAPREKLDVPLSNVAYDAERARSLLTEQAETFQPSLR